MDPLYQKVSFQTSTVVTRRYSTSFSIGVRCLDREVRNAIYGIYGFVRLADEIADTFHSYNQTDLMEEFENEYYRSLERGISLNPVINAFQLTVTRYAIPNELVVAFLSSMKRDLAPADYDQQSLESYIYGSAEAVGLMCLRVFVKGNESEYRRLEEPAKRLGAAFQKVNFLRDLQHDTDSLHRIYFPVLKDRPLDETTKKEILDDIYNDYRAAEEGIRQLPQCARLGVRTAYLYYRSLARKIQRTPAQRLLSERIRIPNREKLMLFGRAYLTTKFDSSW